MRLTGKLAVAVFAISLQLSSHAQLERVANTTLTNLPSSPPTFGYSLANAFPGVAISGAVCIATPPGETNRIFILERAGNIVVITNLAAPTRTVFMSIPVLSDSESGLLGLAFHPGYATNGYFYIFASRSLTTSQGSGRHQRISRFETSPPDANFALTNTELPLITQRDTAGNHNGGDLHFGPDGYLYISVGDEGQQYNGALNAQVITNKFMSAIMRIDVDKRPGNLLPNPHPANTTNYFIPADNPFVGVTSFRGQSFPASAVRTEFYSIGYRNPWRMSFDTATGHFYVADVGQDNYEEVHVITNGANAGWSYYEGLHSAFALYGGAPGRPGIFPNPPAGLDFPIVEYGHGNGQFQGNAVVGGVVYRGSRIAQLYGLYVFADNTSGNVWTLRYNGTTATQFTRILQATNPAAFGVDPRNGDILITQLFGGAPIARINYNTTPIGAPLPATLAGTGAFSDLETLTPNPGIVPYDVNVPFWSDNAIKTRWFSIPNTNSDMTFNANGNWFFPNGSVWIKHFDLQLTNGVPESSVRLETRFIVRGPAGIYGMTYRWDSPTNATLVPEAGLDESLVINDGGTIRTQVWHYPSRSECLACHTLQGGMAIGFNTAQLNRNFDYGAGPENQIAALSAAGYFSAPVTNIHTLPALAPLSDSSVSLEYRIRSYLAANCAQCHQPGGPSIATWDARITTPTANANIINGELWNDGGDTNNRVIAPGSLAHSRLLQRISLRGPTQMPPLDSTLVDTQAVALISAWITNDLPAYQTFADWQLAFFSSTNTPEAGASADPDGDGARNALEYLTGTVPTNSLDAWKIGVALSNGVARILFPQVANRGFEVQSTADLLSPSWSPLNVPGNAPFFSITNRNGVVNDPLSGANKFYRVRVFAP